MSGACIAYSTPERMWYHGEYACPRLVLPEPPAPPEDCCANAEWRGRLCAYHQGFEDGWEALREALEK